jgi:hypothetical protein
VKPDHRRSHKGCIGPLYIGVTGHRGISRHPDLSAIVARECQRLRRRWPAASMVILSGLAEGADRLIPHVAQCVLDAALVPVLPLPSSLYESDFKGSQSRAEYRRLCRTARRTVRAPLMASRRACSGAGEARNHQYAWAGAFVAKRAQVLFALWDGKPARGTGGTADVVRWFVTNATPRHYRIARAPRLARTSVRERVLIHLDPASLQVKRTTVRVE